MLLLKKNVVVLKIWKCTDNIENEENEFVLYRYMFTLIRMTKNKFGIFIN